MQSKTQGNLPAIQVPDHILDIVARVAKDYVHSSRERWIGAYSAEEAARIETNSTHHLVGTAERRELHRSILTKLAARQNMTGEIPDKPILLYVSGPMAAGKSTLLQKFKERAQAEEGQDSVQAYTDPNFERLFQVFKRAQERVMASDFQFYKENLPEFAANNNEFAIIRPEASGLDNAVTAWAKELKTSIVMEQLGDGVGAWAAEQAKTHRFIALGVTTDAATNLERLHERNQRTGQVISDQELSSARAGFNAQDGFADQLPHAEFAILVDSTGPDYKVVYAAENGQKIYDARPDLPQVQKPDSYPAPKI